MKAARMITGLFIIIFFGLPSLFGVVWAVGLIRASVSPEFISDLPREIIREVPKMTDEIFQAAQDKDVIHDENTRAWFQAAAKTGISPRDLMDKTGLMGWLENEVSKSLTEIGQILRGERRPRPIWIDLQPLKNVLLHPEVDNFFRATLQNLPPCDEQGEQRWQQLASKTYDRRGWPACRPSLATAESLLRAERLEAVNDMPKDIEVFEDVRALRFFPFGFSRTIHLLSYLLFIIPAAFIFLGALIAASSPSSFFKWSGVSVFIGSLPVLLLSLFTKHLSLWAIKFGSFSWEDRWSTELHDLIYDKLGWIPSRIIDVLLSPVIAVAGVVCVIGIILFAVSFSVRNSSKGVKKTASPSPPISKPGPSAVPPSVKDESMADRAQQGVVPQTHGPSDPDKPKA
jgi:hypothetical protein